MKKIRKAFTIVELVIVIAVIAILAAVLIPTFSNVIRKANLSADKQAVREMNMALAAYDAANGYGKVHTVEDAMQVLANAGYNSENWVCLTAGYQVYWYEKDNRCILYNSTTAEVEYPNEYDTFLMLTAADKLHIYNENHVKAQQFAMSLSSAVADVNNSQGKSDFTTVTSVTTINGVQIQSGNGNSANNLETLQTAKVQTVIKSALGVQDQSENVYMHATKEEVSSSVANSAYASLQIASISSNQNEVVLKSNGEVSENLFYITIVPGDGDLGMAEAKKAAARYLYNIFDQITTGKLDNTVTIILEKGIELDCSGFEWSPCKTFQGYFGTTDSSNPAVIKGATLTSKTGYSQTVQFSGTNTINGIATANSYYFVTGFFGTVFGNTTIENVTFEDLLIDSPATDYHISDGKRSRNCVGIIGGIINTGDSTKFGSTSPSDWDKVNVKISNINVTSSNITGQASVGGLIGYVGGVASNSVYGTIDIENINMEVNLKSLDTRKDKDSAYSPVGGLIGFAGRISPELLTINVKDVILSGNFDGYHFVTGLLGNILSDDITMNLDGIIDLSEVTFGPNANMKANALVIHQGNKTQENLRQRVIKNNDCTLIPASTDIYDMVAVNSVVQDPNGNPGDLHPVFVVGVNLNND